METLKLKHPIMINGKEVDHLNYDMEEITPTMYSKACAMASDNARKEGLTSMDIMELNGSLHLCLAMMGVIAVDSSIDVADLERLKGGDVIRLTQVGRNFISLSSADDSLPESSEELSEATQESTTPESVKSKK